MQTWLPRHRSLPPTDVPDEGPQHDQRFDAVPFFWSQHYDVAINYVGHAERWESVEVDGDLSARNCAVFHMLIVAKRTLALLHDCPASAHDPNSQGDQSRIWGVITGKDYKFEPRQAVDHRNPSPQTHASAMACWQVLA